MPPARYLLHPAGSPYGVQQTQRAAAEHRAPADRNSDPGRSPAILILAPHRPCPTAHLLLLPGSLDALWTANNVVQQRPDHRNHQNKEGPGHLFIALGGFFRQTINQDPEPENESEDRNPSSPY